MIHSLFVLNGQGDAIIEKHWRGLMSRNICEYFWNEVKKAPAHDQVEPIIATPKWYLIHLQHNGLFILSVVRNETQPLLVFEFMHRVVDVFTNYFGEVDETTIKEHFVTVYQLLDEMLDNGFPFTTEPNVLKEMINAPSIVNKMLTTVMGTSQVNSQLPGATISSIPWRKLGVKYSSNEIYFDVVESIDAVIETNGMASSCVVNADVQCVCKLSGMPDLTMLFSDPHAMEDVAFHPCVRLGRWDQGRAVSFIPPDGAFQLMTYRVKGALQIPVYVKPQVTFHEGAGKVVVTAGTRMMGDKLSAKKVEDVVVHIPFPKATSTVDFTCNMGTIEYDEKTKKCRWLIGKIPKNKTPQFDGTVQLAAGADVPEHNPVLEVDYKIMMYSASSMSVASLNLLAERYEPFKGVRFITKAGRFFVKS